MDGTLQPPCPSLVVVKELPEQDWGKEGSHGRREGTEIPAASSAEAVAVSLAAPGLRARGLRRPKEGRCTPPEGPPGAAASFSPRQVSFQQQQWQGIFVKGPHTNVQQREGMHEGHTGDTARPTRVEQRREAARSPLVGSHVHVGPGDPLAEGRGGCGAWGARCVQGAGPCGFWTRGVLPGCILGDPSVGTLDWCGFPECMSHIKKKKSFKMFQFIFLRCRV